MDMSDASTHCIPCRKSDPGLSATERAAALDHLPDWSLSQNATAIRRRFTFKNYAQALAFVTSVSAIAETESHHPDIAFGWGYVEITFTTHAIGGLHLNDILMAHKVNAIST